MGKRGKNIRRRPDGRWEARVVLGTQKNGRTAYEYLYGRTYREVKNCKQEFLLRQAADRIQSTTDIAVKPQSEIATQQNSFAEAARAWLACKKPTVRESTYACYTIMVRNQILPELGDYYYRRNNRRNSV